MNVRFRERFERLGRIRALLYGSGKVAVARLPGSRGEFVDRAIRASERATLGCFMDSNQGLFVVGQGDSFPRLHD